MDFIISYQSLVGNTVYFKNTSSSIKYNSAVKWTLVAQSKQASRELLRRTCANELIGPYALCALRNSSSQPSPRLRITNCDSRTTDAVSLMRVVFHFQRRIKRKHFVYLSNRNCSFSNSRNLNIHCYVCMGGDPRLHSNL